MRWFAPVLLGVAATLATSVVHRESIARYPDVPACVSGCPAAAAGWPLPYLIDHPAQPPVHSVSLAGAVTGRDRWRMEGLTLDLAVWIALATIAAALLRRIRR